MSVLRFKVKKVKGGAEMLDYETTREVESTEFPGVKYNLYRMTEKRRRDLRARVATVNKTMRDLMRQQNQLMKENEEQRDDMLLIELQEHFDQVVGEELNPTYIQWGVQKISGLAIRGQELGVEEWSEWPSALFEEVLKAVKDEAELNGAARKNSPSRMDTGDPTPETQKPTNAATAKEKDFGKQETADCIIPIM